MAGCTGGTFISEDVPSLYSWIRVEGPVTLVDFERAPRDGKAPAWDTLLIPHLHNTELNRECWWQWNDWNPPSGCTRPPWWDVLNMHDARVSLYRYRIDEYVC